MTDDTPPFTLQRAWEDLRFAVNWLLSACGLPAEIAARRLMFPSTRQEILTWLAPVEAMARRVLLLAALKAPHNLPVRTITRDAPVRSAMRDAVYREPSDNPADWCVLFSDWPQEVRQPKRYDPRDMAVPRATQNNAYPLARRVEALIRLCRDPGAAIQRMARKIALRRGELRFAFKPFRHDGGPVQTLLNDVQAHVDAALWNAS